MNGVDIDVCSIPKRKVFTLRSNTQRPCYSLGYETPVRYYEKYMNGQLEIKDTFSKRILSPEPKYIRKKKPPETTIRGNEMNI